MADRSFFPLHSDSGASRVQVPNCFDVTMGRNSFQRIPNRLQSVRDYKHIKTPRQVRPQWSAWNTLNTHPLCGVDSMSYANMYQCGPSQSGFYHTFPSTHAQLKTFKPVIYPEQYPQSQNFPVHSTHPADGINRFAFRGSLHQSTSSRPAIPLQVESFKDQEGSLKLCTVCNLIFKHSKDYVTHLQLDNHDKLCCGRCKLVFTESVDYLDHIVLCGNYS